MAKARILSMMLSEEELAAAMAETPVEEAYGAGETGNNPRRTGVTANDPTRGAQYVNLYVDWTNITSVSYRVGTTGSFQEISSKTSKSEKNPYAYLIEGTTAGSVVYLQVKQTTNTGKYISKSGNNLYQHEEGDKIYVWSSASEEPLSLTNGYYQFTVPADPGGTTITANNFNYLNSYVVISAASDFDPQKVTVSLTNNATHISDISILADTATDLTDPEKKYEYFKDYFDSTSTKKWVLKSGTDYDVYQNTGTLQVQMKVDETLYAPTVKLGTKNAVKSTATAPTGYVIYELNKADLDWTSGKSTITIGEEATGKITKLDLDKTTASLEVGKTTTLTATTTPATATEKLVWSSDTPTVATISGNDKTVTINALAEGTAKISVVTESTKDLTGTNQLKAECTVTVTKAAPVELSLDKTTAKLYAGETVTLTVSGGEANATYNWKVDNSENAGFVVTGTETTASETTGKTVTVKALKGGTKPVVTVSSEGATSASCTIEIQEEPTVELAIDRSTVQLYAGKTVTLSASGGANNATYSWSVDNSENAAFVVNKANAPTATGSTVTVKALKGGTNPVVTVSSDGAKSASCTIEIKASEISGNMPGAKEDAVWVGLFSSEYYYSGSKITPEPNVYNGEQKLIKGTDYTVSYSNNVKASTSTSKAKVTVKLKGNYSGTLTAEFEIKPIDLEEWGSATIPTVIANGKTQKPTVTVFDDWNEHTLSAKNDYTIETGSVTLRDAGTYKITIKGKGNYTGSTTADFVIAPNTKTLLSKATVTLDKKSYKYEDYETVVTGNDEDGDWSWSSANVTPKIESIKVGKTIVSSNDYYISSYGDNYTAGTATLTLTARADSDYVGDKTVSYKITGTPIKNTTITVDTSAKEYTGSAITPAVTIKNAKGRTLNEWDDYEVTYSKNLKKGTATILITGVYGYTGSVKKTFKINAAKLDKKMFTIGTSAQYAKGGAKASVAVNEGYSLTEGVDYTVKYSKNTTAGSKGTVTIKGKGNYTGTLTEQFDVTATSIANTKLVLADKVTGKSWKSSPTVYDTDGKKLKAGTDYEKKIEYLDASGKAISQAPAAGVVVTVRVTGKGKYKGSGTAAATTTGTYRILASGRDISKSSVKISAKNQVYDGMPVTLGASDFITSSLKYGVDYVIDEDSYKNNDKKGNATVTVKGIGSYGGTKTVKFKITAKSSN